MSQPLNLSQPDLPTVEQLEMLLRSDRPLFPELEAARQRCDSLAASPAMRVVLEQTETYMHGIEHIPQTRYTDYRRFIIDGDRRAYETPYFAKRRQLGAAALRLFLGQRAHWRAATGARARIRGAITRNRHRGTNQACDT